MTTRSKKATPSDEVALHPIVGPDGKQVFAGDPIPEAWDDANKSALREAGSIGPRSAIPADASNQPGEVAPVATTDSARVNTGP